MSPFSLENVKVQLKETIMPASSDYLKAGIFFGYSPEIKRISTKITTRML